MLLAQARPTMINHHTSSVIGASLSEPHTSVTALLDACVCVCRVCLCVAIYRKFKLSERV